jgi:hypothetical protein
MRKTNRLVLRVFIKYNIVMMQNTSDIYRLGQAATIQRLIINYLWAIPLRRCLAKMWHQHTGPSVMNRLGRSIISRLGHIAEKEAGQAASYVHWPGIAGMLFAPVRQRLLTRYVRGDMTESCLVSGS